MKKIKNALMTAILLLSLTTQAQVGIGVSPANIDPSAQLDVSSTSKGFLPPRMSQAERNDIPNPGAGLVVWCSNCGTSGEIEVYNGTNWTNMIGGAAAEAAPLAVGQSYQGGKIAYILQQGDPGYDANVQHGLISATSDQSTGASWINDGSNFGGDYPLIGTTGTAIGTGLANTNAIISIQGNTGTYAAKICKDYQGGGYSDWYLPSKDELNQLFINRVAAGGFANNEYWSSSEFPYYRAWFQSFYDGFQFNYFKDYSLNVRAVRAF